MKNTLSILFFLFILFVLSCDECTLIPSGPVYQTGDTLWIHETPVKDSMFIGNSLAIGKDGSIYYSAAGGTVTWKAAQLFALNEEDGTAKWKTETMDNIGLNSQIVVGDDGTVYAIGSKKLYAFDQDDGSTKWIWEVPETLPYEGYPNGVFTRAGIGGLALTNDGDLICGSVEAGVYWRSLYCIDKNGQKKWHNLDAVNGGVGSGIYIGKNNTAYYYTYIYYGNETKEALVAVNAGTGNILWTIPISSWRGVSNNIAIDASGNLFCAFTPEGSTEMKYHRVDGANGTILWSSSEPCNGGEKWIGPDGGLYEEWSGLYQVNASNGAKTLVVSCEFGSINQNNRLVSAFTDADYKRKLGVFYPDGLIDFSVPMDGLEGHQLVISDDEVIYGIINLHPVSRLPTKICAIQGNAALANSGWARVNHDNRNTSNWSK